MADETPADQLILTEVHAEHVLIIRINRPERRNAFDGATSRALETALDRYELDDSLYCAVLTGDNRVFSAGQDLRALGSGDYGVGERRGGFGIMRQPPVKPLIAAIEGHALAGGFELALACDLIVAARGATMGLPEVKRSLVALGGGAFRLPDRLPYHIALELLLTGEAWPAERMHELGLVNHVTEPGRALEQALALAAKIVANGPLAVRATKEIAIESRSWLGDEAWDKQSPIGMPVFGSADAKEGATAFLEKREPVWQNR